MPSFHCRCTNIDAAASDFDTDSNYRATRHAEPADEEIEFAGSLRGADEMFARSLEKTARSDESSSSRAWLDYMQMSVNHFTIIGKI